MEEAKEFLEELFGDSVSQDQTLLIWQLNGKKSWFFDSCESAARFATERGTTQDMYVGVCLRHGRDFPPGSAPKTKRGGDRRGGNANTTALGGLYVDIDISGEGHKVKGIFESREQATEFILKLPLQPTVVIDSGGGFHCWWIFHEAFEFVIGSDEEENNRTQAQELIHGWQQYLGETAAKLFSCGIDSTHDLSRVLRIPETGNFKTAARRNVAVVDALTDYDRQYNPSEFDGFRVTVAKRIQKEIVVAEGIYFNPDSKPDFERLLALQETSWPELPRVLNRTMPASRFKHGDQSGSAYDLMACNKLVEAGWNDQDIINYMTWQRNKHGDKDHDRQLEYLCRTILLARQWYEGLQTKVQDKKTTAQGVTERRKAREETKALKVKQEQEVDKVIEAIDSAVLLADQPTVTNDEGLTPREQIFELLRHHTGASVDAIYRHGPDDIFYSYKPRNGKGTVKIGDVGMFTSWLTWSNIGFDQSVQTDHDKPKGRIWPKLLRALQAYIEEAPDSTRDRGLAMLSDLQDYESSNNASNMDILTIEDESGAVSLIEKGEPFWSGEELYISVGKFKSWLKRNEGISLTREDIYIGLKRCGFREEKFQRRISAVEMLYRKELNFREKTHVQRRYWCGRLIDPENLL